MALTVGGVAWSPSNKAVAAAGFFTNTSLLVYRWSDATGFGTQYTNPATWTGSGPLGVDFCP